MTEQLNWTELELMYSQKHIFLSLLYRQGNGDSEMWADVARCTGWQAASWHLKIQFSSCSVPSPVRAKFIWKERDMENENILGNCSGDTNKPGKEKKSSFGWGTNTAISSLSKIKCLQKKCNDPYRGQNRVSEVSWGTADGTWGVLESTAA